MGKIAFVFAGQGAQYSGMGKTLFENNAAAKAVFEMADSIRPGTSEMCFTGTAEQLSQTINTQPSLFTVDLACAAAIDEMGIHADMVAGFSLGEIAANAYAGTFSYEDAFRLVCKRAEFMSECAEKNKGSMAAVLKLSNEKVEELASKFEKVYPVNYNCNGQVSVAGAENEMDEFCALVKDNGGRVVKLAVSGAFHSPFMTEASGKLAEVLSNMTPAVPKISVYSNVTAQPYGENIAELIAKQVMSPVKWEKTVLNMIADGADTFIEVGAGKVLSGLIKKISADVRICNVDNFDDAVKTVQAING